MVLGARKRKYHWQYADQKVGPKTEACHWARLNEAELLKM